MPGIPNNRKPFLPDIPLNGGDWQRLRYFLAELKHRVEQMVQAPNLPDPVGGLTQTSVTGGIQLVWNPSNWATGYTIYRGANATHFSDAVAIGYLARAPRLSFFDPSGQFAMDAVLTYWVVATNGLTDSAPRQAG